MENKTLEEIIEILKREDKFINWATNGNYFGYIASQNNFFETTDINGKKIMVQSTKTKFDEKHNIPIFSKPIFSASIPMDIPLKSTKHTNNIPTYGIPSYLQKIPSYKDKNKVLEIGPGHGLLLNKIIQEYGKDNVYAMQPPNAEYSIYNTSIRNRLGDNFLETSLEDYTGGMNFDLILIFKWNIPVNDVDNFINKLYDILTIGGKIYITSVEYERLNLVKGKEVLYLGFKFLKKFKIVTPPTIISNGNYNYEYIVMSK